MYKKFLIFSLFASLVIFMAGGWGMVFSDVGDGLSGLFMAAEIGAKKAVAGKQERNPEETVLLSKIKDVADQLKNESLSLALASDLEREYAEALRALPFTDAGDVLRLNFQGDTMRRLDARIRESFQVIIRKYQATTTLTAADKKVLIEERKRLQDNLTTLFTTIKDLPRMNAVMGVGTTSGNVPLSVELTAINSSDPKSRTISPESFHWSYVDHDHALKNLGTGVEKVVTFDYPGVYVVRLMVESSLDKTVLPGISSSPEIRINPPETTADFSINGSLIPNNGVVEVSVTDARKGLRFDPTLSKVAAERQITQYEWNLNGNRQSFTTPEPVIEKFDLTTTGGATTGSLQQIIGSNKSKPVTQNLVDVSLKVTDNIGRTSTKRVQLAIRKSIAIIKATGHGKNGKFEFRTNSPITFDGSSSAVEDTPSTQYTWTLSGENGFQKSFFEQSFDYTFEQPGEYTMELMVGNGFKTKETYLVLPQPPPAIFSWKQSSPSQPATIRFDASESRDVRGRQLSYSWDFDGNGEYEIQSSTRQIVTWTYDKVGANLVKLAVTDEYGETSISEKAVEITSVLNVDFTADSFAVQPGKEVVFRADAPNAVRFSWNFGDGVTKETQQVTMPYSYPLSGRKEVTLTAFDAANTANSITKSVAVGDGKSPVPQVKVSINGEPLTLVKNLCGQGKDAYQVLRNQLVELDGTDSVNARGEKTGLQFAWDFQNGDVITESVAKRKFSQLSSSTMCSKVVLAVQDTSTGTSAAADETLVYVANAAPSLTQLQIDADQRCDTPCNVGLKVNGGWDADGEITQYRWWAYREGDPEKIGVTITKEPEATIVVPARGAKNEENVYYFVVELTDDSTKSVTSEEVFGHRSEPRTMVNADNPKPAIDFSVNRPIVYVGEAAVFTADAKDPQSQEIPAAAFAWDFNGDDTFDDTSSGPSVSHTFTAPGKYLVALRLRIRGVEVVKEQEITVAEKPLYPHPNFIYTRDGLKISFDAGESKFDPEIPGNRLFYFWDFDTATDSNGNGDPKDDPDANEETVVHEYPTAGTYGVQLSVTDIEGTTHAYEQQVEAGAQQATKPLLPMPIFRTPRLLFNTPAASLDILVKKTASTTENVFDIIIFGRDITGGELTGLPKLKLIDGTADILLPFNPFEDGFSSARISVTGNKPPTIEVTANSRMGTITESLSLPKNSLLPL